jgi:hypothetical protein
MSERARGPSRGPRLAGTVGRFLITAGLLAGLGSLAWAGTIAMSWDPVSDPDVAGYRVYHGLSANNLDQMTDVGLTTSTVLSDLAECTIWHVGVKAYDEGGLESPAFSNLIRGYPKPRIDTLSPESIEPGETLTFTVRGVNFDPGDPGDPLHPQARAYVDYPGVEVEAVEVESCQRMLVTVTAAEWADEGWVALYVENPDLSWDDPGNHPWVFGQKSAAFRVKREDGTGPSVDSTAPGAGATEVPANVLPQVLFSEPVDPSTVTPATVRLVDAAGAPVAAETGSPVVDGATVTIRPARPLEADATYQIAVTGGSGGVADLDGNPMASDYLQSPGFTIMSEARSDESNGPAVRASSPAPGAVDVPSDLAEVRITFDRDMRGLLGAIDRDELRRRFRVLQDGDAVAQANGSPEFRRSGQEVVILLAEPLLESHPYTTLVHLADDGLHQQLEQAGHSDLAMGGVWMTSPAWRVEGPFEKVTWVPGGDTSTSEATLHMEARLSADNTGVAENAEFRVYFSEPVTKSSRRPEAFRVTVQENRRYRPVELEEPIQALDGGRVVVLVPRQPLPSGVRGQVRVFTGRDGVELQGSGGPFHLPAGAPMSAPFATGVSAEPSAWTFGEAGSDEAAPGQMALAWGEPTDELTAGFEVEVLDAAGGEPLQVLDAGPATQLQIPGLEDGREYLFRLRPYDLWGHEAQEAGRDVRSMASPRVDEIDGEPQPGEETLVSLRGANFMDGARVVPRRDEVRFGRATVVRDDLIVVPVIVGASVEESPALTPDDVLVVNPSPKAVEYFQAHPQAADVNGSGTVDEQDVEHLRQRLGVTPGDPRYEPAVDPNGDGVVDGIDVDIIEQHIDEQHIDEQRLDDERTDGRSHRR